MAKKVSVRTRKRGNTYSYAFEAGRTTEGKRKVVEKGGYATANEAYQAGIAAYTAYINGTVDFASSKVKLADYLDMWLEKVSANISAGTQANYSSRIKQLKKYIGNRTLQDLKPVHVDTILKDMYSAGLSYRTISSYKVTFFSALQYAVYPAQLISINPVSGITVPQKAKRKVVKRTVITLEEFKKILADNPFGSSYYIPILVAYHTGMRLGEIIGLTWDNIDLNAKEIHIVQQERYLTGIGHHIGQLKTQTSNRTISIDNILLEELKKWKQLQTERAKEEGYFFAFEENETRIIKHSTSVCDIIIFPFSRIL